MKLFALETCTSCQGQTPANDNQEGGDKFTYDKGEGKKDKIVISGPFSKVLRSALSQIFVKKDLIYSDDPTSADAALDKATEQPATATESQAQDAYIAKVIDDAINNPSTEVVLEDFDYPSHNAHVKAVENGESLPQSQQDPAVIPLYVARAEDLARQDIFDELANSEDLNVVVVSGVDTSSGDDGIWAVNYIATAGGVARALFQSEQNHVISNTEPQSNLIKAAALERFYEGTKVRLFFGMESFVAELSKYREQKKAKAK